MDNDKWQKYLRADFEDYSASCEVDEGARGLHLELMEMMPNGDKVLDIGCGTGWSTSMLAKKYSYAVGITIQHAEINFAISTHYKDAGNVSFMLMDMHELEFDNKFFDTVYMRECLEHSIAPFIALAEANRVLKIGGHIMINTPPVEQWSNWHCHYIVPTPEQLKALLAKCGFLIERAGVGTGGHNYALAFKTNDIEFKRV